MRKMSDTKRIELLFNATANMWALEVFLNSKNDNPETHIKVPSIDNLKDLLFATEVYIYSQHDLFWEKKETF
jgi:hypothetical protein